MNEKRMTTICKYVKIEDHSWESLHPEPLVDVVNGEKVEEPTQVRTCWNEEALYIQFECSDDYVVADLTQRDDPLYDQDVVEVFIDEEGMGKRYLELEFSPLNVVFDAKVENKDGKVIVNTDWDADGLETDVFTEGNKRIYLIKLPFSNFEKTPEEGTEWRINFYRIDEDRNGKRHFQAWSPTGAVDYHISSRFGTLLFTR